MRLSRNGWYLLCQLVGWGLYGTLGLFYIQYYGSRSEHPQAYLMQGIVTSGMALASHGLRMLLKRGSWWRGSARRMLRLVGVLPLVAAIALLGIVLVMAGVFKLVPFAYYTLPRLTGFWVNMTIVMGWWTVIYVAVHALEDRQRAEVDRWKIQAELHQAQLSALKSHLNPHFVFNSLNTLRAMILEDPHRAREMVTYLSGLLRYTIQFNQHDRVPLAQELEVVREYLALEAIQFDDRLRYQIEADPALLGLPVPPMSVQLLVENAIKHGIAQQPDGGEVRVRAHRVEGRLAIEVVNTGQLKVNGPGIGLTNAMERLKLLFGQQTEFSLQNQSAQTVAARFSIPLDPL